MRQRLTIILTFIVIIGLLVVLNSLTFVQSDKAKDLEISPNRSTYHAGPTGTRALYDLLSESGYKVMRWREEPERLLGPSGDSVATFVLIGPTPVELTPDHAAAMLGWVARGGRLVIVDRHPDSFLLSRRSGWTITAHTIDSPGFSVDPGDVRQMTENLVASQPVQSTVLTRDVRAVMPSKFGARLSISPDKDTGTAYVEDDVDTVVINSNDSTVAVAPVVHVADKYGAILVDRVHGLGRIIILSDPYIFANGGISLNDNLQLALNTIAGQQGLIAFDEYHQGKGVTGNPFARYFAGTPVLPIAAQIVVLVIFVVWTNGRRFARPLPLPQVDRRSSLEFVASMSELQERSRAYDLAIENIYSRTRRVLARYAAVDYNSSRAEIASRVALRSTVDAQQLETLMRQCEEAINGAPITWRQSLELVRRLREVETSLGLRMRSRDLRQAAENI
jgi:hypothetical protein